MKKIIGIMTLLTVLITGCATKSSITLEGDIQNNIISSISIVSGKIIEMEKKQGEFVKKGDIIAIIDNTNQKYIVEQLQAVVNMKQAKLDEIKNGARPEEIEAAEAQARATKAQLELLLNGNRNEQIEQARNEVAIAEENLNIISVAYDNMNMQYQDAVKLFEEGILSKYEMDYKRIELDQSMSQLSSAKYRLENAKQQLQLIEEGSTVEAINIAQANYDGADAKYQLIKDGPTKETIIIAQADLDQSVAQLKQAQNTLENCTIKALEDGIIISKNYDLGDVVNIGSNIVDIAISNDVYVLCYIPVKYLDKIVYDQELEVTTVNGRQKGKVSYIDLETEYTPKDKQTNEDRKNKSVKIHVTIDDEKGTLKSGMTAEVKIPKSH